MTPLRISELADRAGVPVSTLRYYERIGLLSPVERLANGYRSFDEASLEQLSFIGRAKRMGIPLSEVAELIEVWMTSGCRPFQDRIRTFVAHRIDDVEAQRSELIDFVAQLRALSLRLEGRDGSSGVCELDCDCVHLEQADPLAMGEMPATAAALGCQLEPDQQATRLEQWRALVSDGTIVGRGQGYLLVEFAPDPEFAAQVARLASLEVECCSALTIGVEISRASIILRVGGAPATASEFIRQVVSALPTAAT